MLGLMFMRKVSPRCLPLDQCALCYRGQTSAYGILRWSGQHHMQMCQPNVIMLEAFCHHIDKCYVFVVCAHLWGSICRSGIFAHIFLCHHDCICTFIVAHTTSRAPKITQDPTSIAMLQHILCLEVPASDMIIIHLGWRCSRSKGKKRAVHRRMSMHWASCLLPVYQRGLLLVHGSNS